MSARIREHIRTNVVGYLALFCFAIAGTADALPGTDRVDSGDIVDGEVKRPDLAGGAVNSAKVAPDSLTAADIAPAAFAAEDIARQGSLNTYGVASDAIQSHEVSANTLTGADIDEGTLSVAGLGCQAGTVRGSARIKGESDMPDSFTSSSTWIDTKHNCSGGAVEVRRIGTGVYQVRFSGLSPVLAVATSNASDDLGACRDNFVAVWRIASVESPGTFHVESHDDDGDQQHCWINVAVI